MGKQSLLYEEGKVYFTIPWDEKVSFTIPWDGKVYFTKKAKYTLRIWQSILYDPMGCQSLLYEEGKVYLTKKAKYTLRSHGMSKYTLLFHGIPKNILEDCRVDILYNPMGCKVYFTLFDHSCWAGCATIAPVYISVCRKEYITNRLQTPKYNKRKKEENKRQWDKYPPPEKSQA